MQLEIIKDIEAMSDDLTGDVKGLTNFTPCLMVFVGKNILTDEKTDCHFLSLKTVREDISFYTYFFPSWMKQEASCLTAKLVPPVIKS
jgi:hypothetical protein